MTQIRIMELCEVELKRRFGQEYHDPEGDLSDFADLVADRDDLAILETKEAAKKRFMEGLYSLDVGRSVEQFRAEEWT